MSTKDKQVWKTSCTKLKAQLIQVARGIGPAVKDMDNLLSELSIVFMVQTSQYLQMQAEERLV